MTDLEEMPDDWPPHLPLDLLQAREQALLADARVRVQRHQDTLAQLAPDTLPDTMRPDPERDEDEELLTFLDELERELSRTPTSDALFQRLRERVLRS